MRFDYQAFRTRYRANISRWYSGWLHLLMVAFTGITVITYSLLQTQTISGIEWLVIPLTLLLVNFAEYVAHRWLGHRKTRLGRLFYSRHTGDHHSFFVETAMPFESTRDWRVVLFPAWLIYVFLIGLMLPGGWILLQLWSANAAWLFVAAGIAGYLFYEVMHFSYHLPASSFVERTPVWWRLQRLHQLHHERERMTDSNFNITIPVFDWLLGTLYWREPETESVRHE